LPSLPLRSLYLKVVKFLNFSEKNKNMYNSKELEVLYGKKSYTEKYSFILDSPYESSESKGYLSLSWERPKPLVKILI